MNSLRKPGKTFPKRAGPISLPLSHLKGTLLEQHQVPTITTVDDRQLRMDHLGLANQRSPPLARIPLTLDRPLSSSSSSRLPSREQGFLRTIGSNNSRIFHGLPTTKEFSLNPTHSVRALKSRQGRHFRKHEPHRKQLVYRPRPKKRPSILRRIRLIQARQLAMAQKRWI